MTTTIALWVVVGVYATGWTTLLVVLVRGHRRSKITEHLSPQQIDWIGHEWHASGLPLGEYLEREIRESRT